MTYEEELQELINEKELKKKELDKVRKALLMLDDEYNEAEDVVDEVSKRIKEFRKAHFEEGFGQWKQSLSEEELNGKPYTFTLSKEGTLKAKYLQQVYSGNSGSIGGSASYEFTPTSIGDIITVRIKGKDFDLTDYSNF